MQLLAGIACSIGVCAINFALCAQTVYPVRSLAPCPGDRETIEMAKKLLGHTFVASARGEQPSLEAHLTPVRIDGVPDAFLVEVARSDSRAEPFRTYVLQVYERRGDMRIRTFELFGAPGLKEALSNLWGTPPSLSLIDATGLAPSLDMPVIDKPRVGRSDLFVAETEHPFPVNRDGAIEITASITFGGAWLILSDTGYDAAGKKVWDTAEPVGFVQKDDDASVRYESDGLTIITTAAAPSDAPKLRPASEGGGELTIHFTYWTSTGQKIDTSRKPGREPAKVRIPGGTPFPALDTALAGIAKGERRKIVVPASLAYGANGRGTVPPNATLIYDIECLDVNNNPSAAPPTSPHSAPPPAGFNPHAPSAPRAPAAPRGDEPIGSPPTNGTPETPR
jgi:hypothetical protein